MACTSRTCCAPGIDCVTLWLRAHASKSPCAAKCIEHRIRSFWLSSLARAMMAALSDASAGGPLSLDTARSALATSLSVSCTPCHNASRERPGGKGAWRRWYLRGGAR